MSKFIQRHTYNGYWSRPLALTGADNGISYTGTLVHWLPSAYILFNHYNTLTGTGDR